MTNCYIPHGIRRAARLTVLGLTLAAALPAMAQRTIAGPYLDFAAMAPAKGLPNASTQTVIQVEGMPYFNSTLDPNTGVIINYQGWAPIGPAPFQPCGTTPGGWAQGIACINWTVNDGVTVSPLRMGANPVDIPIKGLSYFSYDLSDRSGNVLVTTLYGQDVLNGSRLQMAAFDPVGPALALSNERIFGSSGRVYTPTVSAAVSLGDLSSVLGPGYDISGISGDPHGSVYLFQTNVPVFEISSAVPEPTSYALLAGGLAVLSVMRRRKPAAHQA